MRRLMFAKREKQSHWSFDESLRTHKPRKPRKPKTQEELAADALKLFAQMGR